MRITRSMDASMSSEADYNIAAATDIKEGQIVKLTGGLVVLAAAGETAAILGVAKENHSGVADAFNLKNNGRTIRVFDSPATVFEAPAPRATATSGSATTMAATGLAVFADDDFNGGYIRLVSKTATSTNTDPIGKLYEVTDFTAATKLFTVASGQTHNVGDVYEIYTPVGFLKGNLDSGISKLVLTTNANTPFKVYGQDFDRGLQLYVAALHINANKQS